MYCVIVVVLVNHCISISMQLQLCVIIVYGGVGGWNGVYL